MFQTPHFAGNIGRQIPEYKCSFKFRHESPSLSSLEVIAYTIENKMAAWRKKRPHKLRLVFQFVATLKELFFLIWHLQACL